MVIVIVLYYLKGKFERKLPPVKELSMDKNEDTSLIIDTEPDPAENEVDPEQAERERG
ncbi:MAG: hypothetical protein LE169_02075 [Endomicrobium sp.]|nr:hypothetical protein [Endomicrobium sp.]